MPESHPEQAVKAERLLPTHIADRAIGIKPGYTREDTGVFSARSEALSNAEPFEDVMRGEAERKGIEVSPDLNLSLIGIEEFQKYVKDAQSFRKIIKGVSDPRELVKATAAYQDRKGKIDEYLAFGASFEDAYREYIRERNKFVHFELDRERVIRLEHALASPSFASLSPDAKLTESDYARIEHIVRGENITSPVSHEEQEEQLQALRTVFPPGSEKYEEAKKTLEEGWNPKATVKGQKDGKTEPIPSTKKEIMDEIEEVNGRIVDAWENPMVRRFWQEKQIQGLLRDFSKGEAVLETQSTIHNLNKIYEWEQLHQRTTVGGVFVGPPGVGKTTLIRHYLEQRGRNYAYMDLSEDVTRYMLYGTRSIEFKNTTEFHRTLLKDLKEFDEDGFKAFISENAKMLQDEVGLNEDQATVTTLANLPLDEETFGEVKGKVIDYAQKAFARELGSEFAHLGKKNGWRDGMIITALRRGDSVIMDEFNKNRNWSLIYGLTTAIPGEMWDFEDNNEHIKIPEDWRMYFTANIGKKHMTFEIAEALASRAGGKVMEIDYPPVQEEMMVALTSLSDTEGNFLRSQEDLAKLYVTIHELFPKVRTHIEGERQIHPISYRTIRDLGEKLVMVRDPNTKKPVYHPTNISFDSALYEIMVESYSTYESKDIPREIVNLATSIGLLLDDGIKDKVLTWMDEDVYNERREAKEKNKEDFDEIVKKIRGLSHMAFDLPLPDQRSF